MHMYLGWVYGAQVYYAIYKSSSLAFIQSFLILFYIQSFKATR